MHRAAGQVEAASWPVACGACEKRTPAMWRSAVQGPIAARVAPGEVYRRIPMDQALRHEGDTTCGQPRLESPIVAVLCSGIERQTRWAGVDQTKDGLASWRVCGLWRMALRCAEVNSRRRTVRPAAKERRKFFPAAIGGENLRKGFLKPPLPPP